jgi:hypothetical protein
MTVNIFLVNFALDESGAYIDGRSDLIESVTLPFNLFQKLAGFDGGIRRSQLKVFEDENKCASFQIDCYLPDDVSRLRDSLRTEFLDKLRKSAAEIGSATVDQVEPNFLRTLLSAFKLLTNLDALLTQKLERFREDESIVVRVHTNE